MREKEKRRSRKPCIHQGSLSQQLSKVEVMRYTYRHGQETWLLFFNICGECGATVAAAVIVVLLAVDPSLRVVCCLRYVLRYLC